MNTRESADEAATDTHMCDVIDDLEALRTMASYMQAELMRLGSGGFWLVAPLPKLIEEEIMTVREGRPLLPHLAKPALS